jgi:hypothetical protein
VEEVEQMEDITAITAIVGPPVSATEEVVPLATSVSSTVGEDGRQVAEVTPPSPNMAFQMVARDPPPLAILAPGFPPDIAETADRVGVIFGPNGHEVSVPPPHIPSLAPNKVDRHEGGSMNKKEAKLKKQKDRE